MASSNQRPPARLPGVGGWRCVLRASGCDCSVWRWWRWCMPPLPSAALSAASSGCSTPKAAGGAGDLPPLLRPRLPRPSTSRSRRTCPAASGGGSAAMQAADAAASAAWQASVTKPSATSALLPMLLPTPPPASTAALPAISRTAAALVRPAFTRTRPKPCIQGTMQGALRSAGDTQPAQLLHGMAPGAAHLQDAGRCHAQQLQGDGRAADRPVAGCCRLHLICQAQQPRQERGAGRQHERHRRCTQQRAPPHAEPHVGAQLAPGALPHRLAHA